MTHGAWTAATQGPGSGSAWAGRRYALSDLPAVLWRERRLMLAVFLALSVLGMAAALTLKTRYEAYSSVLVRLGQEYVYEPRVGDAGRGTSLDSGRMVQSELEILGAAPLKLRVIERLGLAQTYPDLARAYAKAATPAEKTAVMGRAVRAIEQGLAIETAPNTPIVRVRFSHQDPKAAALILNTLLEEYLIFRRAVLIDPGSPALEQQRQVFEARLADAEAAYEAFLTDNRIGDFAAEKASVSQLQAGVEQQRLQTDAQLQARIGRLASLSAQLDQAPREVVIYRDASGGPGARVQGEGGRWLGINPVHQALQTEKIQLTSEIGALRRAQAELKAQAGRLTERRLALAALEPRFQELSLNRAVLQAGLRDFAVKEEQRRADREIAARASENIRIVQRAAPPTQGKSLRGPVIVTAFLVAAVSALFAGLLAMVLRPGLPTPQSAARTLGLPVLGAASLKGR